MRETEIPDDYYTSAWSLVGKMVTEEALHMYHAAALNGASTASLAMTVSLPR